MQDIEEALELIEKVENHSPSWLEGFKAGIQYAQNRESEPVEEETSETKKEDEETQEEQEEVEEETTYTCDDCGKEFEKKWKHYPSQHNCGDNNEDGARYSCSECGKEFDNPKQAGQEYHDCPASGAREKEEDEEKASSSGENPGVEETDFDLEVEKSRPLEELENGKGEYICLDCDNIYPGKDAAKKHRQVTGHSENWYKVIEFPSNWSRDKIVEAVKNGAGK